MSKCIAVIQARMGSSRLPGKMLRPLVGKPLFWHIVHRLRKSEMLDDIVLATSVEPGDDPLAQYAEELGIGVVRGPEDNVLERFRLAYERYLPGYIVRICGDAALVEASFLDTLLRLLIESGADFTMIKPGCRCAHEGIDPMSARALEKLLNESADDPVAKEHITGYFKKNPGFVQVQEVVPRAEDQFECRMSLDTPADFEFMEKLYQLANAKPGELDLQKALQILRERPDLHAINQHVHQKGLDEQSGSVLIRCDGGGNIGMGHVIRCLALADELRESHGVGVTFAMLGNEECIAKVRAAGYLVEVCPEGEEEEIWLSDVIDRCRPDCLIMDFRTDLPRSAVETWRKQGLQIVTIDDPSDRRLAADLAFYPPVPQMKKMDWTGFSGTLYCGWEWVILRPQFSRLQKRPTEVSAPQVPTVLVTMGGTDPAGLTLKAMEALELVELSCRVVVVIGSGFMHREQLDSLLAQSRRTYEIRKDVADMASLMAEADLAVASFGVTAYELAAAGVPGIFLCLTEDHIESASVFVSSGMGVSLGDFRTLAPVDLAREVKELLKNISLRGEMSRKCQRAVDAQGCVRIGAQLLERSNITETPMQE